MDSLHFAVAEPFFELATACQNVAPVQTSSRSADRLFVSVVAPHLTDAHSLARWLTGSAADAQDVVQEASIRALRGIDRFANGNARAWVLAIVRNTAHDWLRKNRPAAVVYADDLEDVERLHVEPDAATPETVLLKMEIATALEAAILALPDHYRETLLLRDVQGLSYRDIAVRCGVSIGTTMSRLFRARRQLIAIMSQNGQSELCGAETRKSKLI